MTKRYEVYVKRDDQWILWAETDSPWIAGHVEQQLIGSAQEVKRVENSNSR